MKETTYKVEMTYKQWAVVQNALLFKALRCEETFSDSCLNEWIRDDAKKRCDELMDLRNKIEYSVFGSVCCDEGLKVCVYE